MEIGASFVLRHGSWLPWLFPAAWVLIAAGAAAGWWRPRGDWFFALFLTVIAAACLNAFVRWRRERVIREAPLPHFLKRKLRQAYPHLSQKDAELVERGLRQFFLACSRSRKDFVSMPSRVVDAMWHEFILHTQAYRDWCQLALGRFLHHTPAEVLGGDAKRNDGLRRAWFWCCRDEAIDPRKPTRLPLLFALDAKLAIADGLHYTPDCDDIERKADGTTAVAGAAAVTYCATEFAGGSAPGDAGHFGGAETATGSDPGGADGGDGGGCGGGGGD